MAAGDTMRAWFPEMLEELRRCWNELLGWEALGALCSKMTELRKQVRAQRGIGSARTVCKCCGGEAVIGPALISVRSLLLALRKSDQITDDTFEKLDGDWAKYRKQHGLNAYGKKLEA